MNAFFNLKPAETLLILKGSKAEFKDLLKYTMMDLCMKQVLEIGESTNTYERAGSTRTQTSKYVKTGKNFLNYKPAKFEEVFISTFYKSPELRANFKPLIKVAYEAAKSVRIYRTSIRKEDHLNSYFKQNVLQLLYNGFSHTHLGIIKREELSDYLEGVDKRIGKLIKEDSSEALILIKQLGGNVFLLKNIDYKLLSTIDKNLIDLIKSPYSDGNNDNSYWYGFDSYTDCFFDSWESNSDSFDAGYDAAGCSSSDSGCSSCSGCGGCGGCN